MISGLGYQNRKWWCKQHFPIFHTSRLPPRGGKQGMVQAAVSVSLLDWMLHQSWVSLWYWTVYTSISYDKYWCSQSCKKMLCFHAHQWASQWSERIVSKSSFACRYTRALLLLLQQPIITRTHNPKTMQDHIQVNSWNKCKDTCACTFHIEYIHLDLNNTTSGKVVKHQAASCWAETMQTIGIQYRKLTPSLLRT